MGEGINNDALERTSKASEEVRIGMTRTLRFQMKALERFPAYLE